MKNHLKIRLAVGLLLACFIVSSGCDGMTGPDLETEPPEPEMPDPEVTEPRLPDAALGKAAFVESCAGCHAGRDGFDLAYFGFSDEDIVRRGVAHVDTTTVLDIVAYIRSLNVEPVGDTFRPFQPTGEVLQDDVAFAVNVFGEDRWPVEMTQEELLVINTSHLPVALPFPLWSDEDNDSDWMPDRPLPEALLDQEGGLLRTALEDYYNARSIASLLNTVEAFEAASRDVGEICEGSPGFHVNPKECFEARRWMASLTAVHLLQYGIPDPIPLPILDLWWAVGDAEVSRVFDDDVNGSSERIRRQKIASSWLMMSWVYEPFREEVNELYFAEFLKHAGLHRHGGFTGLYWMAFEPTAEDAVRPYILFSQVIVGLRIPNEWYYDAATWGYQALIGYVDAGLRPQEAESWEILQEVLRNMDYSLRGSQNLLTQEEATNLRAMHQELQTKLFDS